MQTPHSLVRPLTILLLPALGAAALFAQSSLPELRTFPTGAELLASGHELNHGDTLTDALAKYEAINENDTTYEDALMEIGVIHYKQKEFGKCEQDFLRGRALNGKKAHQFVKNLALLYKERKDFDKALAILDEGLKDFPRNVGLLYTRGEVLEVKGDVAEALGTYMDCARANPFYPPPHLRISAIAVNEGALAQAALAEFYYLYVTSGGDNATNALAWVNEFLRGSIKAEPKNVAIPGREAYADLDLLLGNRVALSKGYKAYKDLTLPFARQFRLMMDQLSQSPPSGDFFSDFYVPVFLQQRKEGLEEGFLFQCLGYSTNEGHLKTVKKNAAKRDKWLGRASDIVDERLCTFPEALSTGKHDVRHFYDKNALAAFGVYLPELRKLSGEASYFHANGRLASHGMYDEQGRRQGLWTFYYPNGQMSEREYYRDDEVDGSYAGFLESGARKDSGSFKAGKAVGPFYNYDLSGVMWRMRTFDGEGANGPAERYFQCGAKSYDMVLKDGNATGAVNGYYVDGKKKFEGIFLDDKRNGTNREYDREGRVLSEVTYVMDKAEGPYKYYHDNGKLRVEGQSKADNLVGERRSYHANGVLEEIQRYNDKGKADGQFQEYDDDGKLTYETTWVNGKLMAYKYYDKSGAVIADAKRQKGAFDFVGHFANGAKASQGRYRDGEGKEGEWTYFWEDGSLRSHEVLVEDKLEGRVDNYFRNGALSGSSTYKDGDETGPFCIYYANGAKQEEGTRIKGELDGVHLYYRADGSLENREFYQQGELQGVQYSYDPDGRVIDKTWYDHGIFTGIATLDTTGRPVDSTMVPPGVDFVVKGLYADGSLKREHPYRNRIAHGPYRSYFPNGKVAVEGMFVNGQRDGEWKFHFPSGSLSGTVVYDLGTRNGPDVDYYENGKKRAESMYVHGRREGDLVYYYDNGQVSSRVPQFYGMDHGTATYYTDQGAVEMVRYYFMDRLVGYSYEGPDGKLVDTIPVVNETGHLETKFRNGRTARTMDLKNGLLNGDLVQYSPEGKLLGRRSYLNNMLNGPCELYRSNGQPLYKGNYICGQEDGEHLSYYPDGKLKERAWYRSGDEHGITLRYDRTTGKVTEKRYYRNGDLLAIIKP
jgi:antitoxin component YwqK of YwqJK toxin-antitoxin module